MEDIETSSGSTADMAGRLDRILDFMEASVKTTVDFAADQIPDVVRQIILWKMVQFGMCAAACLILMIVLWRLWRKPLKMWSELTEDGKAGTGILMFLTLFPFGGFVYSGMMTLKMIVAPKIYLIEYIASFVTSK